jgi:LysM repeat protein
MATATLSALAVALQAEAQRGEVSLDAGCLAQRVLDLIARALLLDRRAIALRVAAREIFLQNDPTGTPTLWIEDATVPADDRAFLHLGGQTANLAIQQTTANDPTGFDLVLAVTLPDTWTFGDSLPPLAGLQPPDYLSTPHGQSLYFSSFSAPQARPVFPSHSGAAIAGDSSKILAEGLTYYAEVGLGGILAPAQSLLKLAALTLPLHGAVTPDAHEPQLDLRTGQTGDGLKIGFLELGVPWIGVKTVWVAPPQESSGKSSPTSSEPRSPNLVFYVGALVGVDPHAGEGAIEIEIDVYLVDPLATELAISVGAPSGKRLSVASVAEKLLGTDAAELKKHAEPLDCYLGAITLESFSALVTVAPPSIRYLQAEIGTSPAWPIGDWSLNLTFTWTAIFTTPLTWWASFDALLTVSTKPELAFDVTVTVPELTIAGTEHGTLDLQLSDLNKIYPLHIPPGLVDLKLTDFAVAIATTSGSIGSLSLFGEASVSIAPFGTPVLALRDVNIALAVDFTANPRTHTLKLDGTIALGTIELAGNATISNVPGTKTVFTLHLEHETVGSMLNHLIHLVDPTYDLTLPDPWDRLLQIGLDAFVLEVNLTDGIVSLAYEAKIDLEFLKIEKLSLNYRKGSASTASAVTVGVEGDFLGVPFGGGGEHPALAWDAINESPPSVPGKGGSLLDLRYAGLGQHIGFQGTQPETIGDAIAALKAAALPIQPGQLPQLGGSGQLSFQGGSDWLIGADLTLMDTVAIAAIFNDPELYGVRFSLAGEKARSFAGLSFEILYRKVTDTIGVYHIELKLPDAMRNLQFGEVSITLPIVALDVYTNGNFRIDFGFPKGLDFSRSFSVQVFPFVGYGGFYFALLDGATSKRVPRIVNGDFHPVIEFGVALSLGVGKTIDEGVLSGGLSVTVIGILEGVLAWFHPTDSSPEETYYWFQGTVAVIGRLYATIDFAIVQASVDVTAYLSVTLRIEAHEPIYIEATASVAVRVSVKIVFFTIHLSFHATIHASFTIGSATPTPWRLAAGEGAASDAPRRQLSRQRTLHAPPVLSVRRRRALRRARVAQTITPITRWPAVCVLPQGRQTVRLWAIPTFTKAAVATSAEAIVLLAAENSIDPRAAMLAEHRATVGEDPASAPFNLLMQAMLGWGIYVETNGAGGPVRAEQLEDLRQQLGCPETFAAAFDYATLTEFLAANFTFDIAPARTAGEATGAAAFPMIPAISLADSAGTSVDFATHNTVEAGYRRNVRAYFQLLAVQYRAALDAGGANPTAALAAADGPVSLASVVFSQYFAMLMSQGVKAAIDLLAAFSYMTGATAMSVAEIARAAGDPTLASEPLRVVAPNQGAPVLAEGALIDLPDVVHQVRSGETFASIAAALAALGALNAAGVPYAAADVLATNGDARDLFDVGAAVEYPGIVYRTQAGDTLNLITARLVVRLAAASLVNTLPGLPEQAQALLKLNPQIPGVAAALAPASTVALSGSAPYTAVAGDTLILVAAYRLAPATGAISLEALLGELKAANPGLPVSDPAAAQPPGTRLQIPKLTRPMAGGDSVQAIADSLVADAQTVAAALLDVRTPLLRPQAVLAVPLRYRVAHQDSFAAIAAKLDVTLAQLATRAALADGLFAPTTQITIEDVDSIDVGLLMAGLLEQAEWNNAAGIVSRFLLAGLRLPDPDDPQFAHLTPEQLADPTILAAIPTRPLYALTGQQYPIAYPLATSYEITLSAVAAAAGWLSFGGSSSSTFALTGEERQLLAKIAETPLEPGIQTLTRLALFRMTPARTALQRHIAWQAAAPPPACVPAGASTGNPSIWVFPDALLLALAQAHARTPPPELLYEVVVARDSAPERPTTVTEAGSYVWATIVNFAVSPPATDGPAQSVANACAIEGADDTGAELLQQVHAALAGGARATLYLLYPPDPTGANPSGLASDRIDPKGTFLLKTNLTTLTARDNTVDQPLLAVADADPTGVYAATIADAADFVALLWEASITRSGGFYLSYANADSGAGLPASAFGAGGAQLSLVAVLDQASASAPGPLLPFHNCAIVGENVDTTVCTVFAQPATYTVQEGDSLSSVAKALESRWHNGLTAVSLATLNAAVALLLRVGAQLSIPGRAQAYEIGYGDTLAGIVRSFAAHGTDFTLAQLVEDAANATAAILAPGAPMQLALGVLEPAAGVPPGTAGFEIARINPDPENLPYNELSGTQLVAALFNLVGWSIGASSAFVASGAGLPTTPAVAPRTQSDGLTPLALDDTTDTSWHYTQALAVAPFGQPRHGSVSPALAPPARNPYNGIGFDADTGQPQAVSIQLTLQDLYGNVQRPAAPHDRVQVPVGYFDDVVGLAAWPSLGISYLVSAPATLTLTMTTQQARYVPSASVSVGSALAAIAADLASYTAIHYQLAQPDLTFALQSTLALAADGQTPTRYPLAKTPFLAFARGAYVYLAALATLRAVELEVSGSATSVQEVREQYGVSAQALFEANQHQTVAALFGARALSVPAVYVTVQGDSLQSIVAHRPPGTLTVASLAELNRDVPLDAGTDLLTAPRSVAAANSDRLSDLAGRAHAAVAALAVANQDRADVLVAGTELVVADRSHRLAAGESLRHAAEQLGATVPALALANQAIPGLFVDGASLHVEDALAAAGDTLAGLAGLYAAGGVASLAAKNAAVANLFAPATPLRVGLRDPPVGPAPGDTLVTFAQANGVSVAQLAAANAGAAALFADGAQPQIPGTLQPTQAARHCTFSAAAADTIAGIAARFGLGPAELVVLNPDLPGLLAAGQTVTDAASGKTLTTQPDDSFQSIVERFRAAGANVSLAQLAGDVAQQGGLLSAGGLWTCPPMRGDAHGQSPHCRLAELAAAYRTDAVTLATANAATLGVLAAGQTLSAPGWPSSIHTTAHETFNSLCSRLAGAGVHATVAEVALALEGVAGLIDAQAELVAVPPPSPPGNGSVIEPRFGAAVFRVLVNVVIERDARNVDPDFAAVASVHRASCPVAPEPDPHGTDPDQPYTLKHFAAALQAALDGLAVATGDPAGEEDPASASAIFAVNFSSPHGPRLSYSLSGQDAAYFALPPLSRAPLAGTVGVIPYVSGQDPPLVDPAQSQTFQAVDLDGWLNAFLAAVDLFLSPAYAVPAYSASPGDFAAVVQAKQILADALAGRVAEVLAPARVERSDTAAPPASQAAAAEAMRQALLRELSSAFTIDTLVQLPVAVGSQSSDPEAAPRLSGRLVPVPPKAGATGTAAPQAYSFSSAKIALTDPSSTATFQFSVKAPTQHRQVDLQVAYAVSELELPNPGAKIGDYEGSSWLSLLLGLAPAALAPLAIPVPLRAYPSPVTLARQTARQTVDRPAGAADLLGWNLEFVYRHDDAEQDIPLVEVAFDPDSDDAHLTAPRDGTSLTAIFAALAQWATAYPVLKDDLAQLALIAPGTQNPRTTAAVKAFAKLVTGVAGAFAAGAPHAASTELPPTTLYYQLRKEQTQDLSPTLTNLVVAAIDPVTGESRPNPLPQPLWPAVIVTLDGRDQALKLVDTTATQATYAYPPGVPADAAFPQRLEFAWPSGAGGPSPSAGAGAGDGQSSAAGGGERPSPTAGDRPLLVAAADPTPGAAQSVRFQDVGVLSEQSARAGVSIWRNSSLIKGRQTNPAFIYQTPIARFPASVVPSVLATEPIPIGSTPTGVAEALGTFFKELVTSRDAWQPDDTIATRLGGGYSYAVAQTPASTSGEAAQQLGVLVPIFLIASVEFHPAAGASPNPMHPADWDWTDPGSLVSQVQAVVDGWRVANRPSSAGGAFVFDLTAYARRGQLQPLIHALALRYALS